MNQRTSPDRAEEARSLFHELIELSAAQQQERLAALGSSDVRQEVESLLAAYSESDDVLEKVRGLQVRFDMSPREPDPHGLIGSRIGRYEITRHLGHGGMGVVYRATDHALERQVALKFISPRFSASREARQRLKREAKAASALDHPNIATVYEIDEAPSGLLYIATAYYKGETLKEKMASRPLPIAEALDYACQIATGLKKAHEAGIIHRDVKPANVMITDEGVAKIVDFGLAKVADSDMTRTGSTLGTAAYMSPEQLRGESIDHRTDLWSFGVTLYEMLSGRRPFVAENRQAISYKIVSEEPPPIRTYRPEIPSHVADVVDCCLKKTPSDRCTSATELLSKLRAAITSVDETRSRSPNGGSIVRKFLPAALRKRYTPAAGWTAAVIAAAALLLVMNIPGQFGGISQLPPGETVPRLAVMAPASHSFMGELEVRMASLLTEMAPHLPEGTEIVAPTELGKIATVEQARERFGVTRVITLHLDESSPPRLTLNLVDAANSRQLRSASLTLGTSGRPADDANVARRLAQLLNIDLPPSLLRRLSPAHDPDARAYFEKGRQALETGQREGLETAIRFFDMALRQDSTYPEVYAGLAEAYWRSYQLSGDPADRRQASRYEDRIRTHEGSPWPGVYVQRGLLNALRGDYQNALYDFKTAVSLDSTHTEAHRGLAQTYAALGRTEDAERSFQEAVRLNPQDWRTYNAFGRFYFMHLQSDDRYAKAAQQFRKVIAVDSLNGSGYANLGSVLLQQGRYEEAGPFYEKALKAPGLSSGSRIAIQSNLGTIYYYLGRYEEAAETYESALEMDSSSQRVWGNLASSYHQLGRMDQAHQAARRATRQVKRALDVRPDDPGLLCDQAEYALILGDRTRVRDLIQRALAQNPRQASVIFQIGHLYEMLGERRLALDYIARALNKGYAPAKIDNDPELANLRSDPRFQQMVEAFPRDADRL